MTKPAHILRDADGNPVFAVLPFDECERLMEAVEDAADIQASDTHMIGSRESFPESVVDRLVNGENAVKVYREHRGMTRAQLAAAAQISQVYVSQTESGRREGRIDVLNRIAKALDVPLETCTDWPSGAGLLSLPVSIAELRDARSFARPLIHPRPPCGRGRGPAKRGG